MTLEKFLQELMLIGTELWVEDGELQIREPKEGLSPAQRAQLAHAADEIMRILPTFSFDTPLSYGQEALWLVQQANADSLAYNTGTLLHMHTAATPQQAPSLVAKLKATQPWPHTWHACM